MTVAIDTTVLILMFDDTAAVPNDLATGLPIQDGRSRIENLILELEKRKERLIIPTPVLAEVLVKAGNAAQEWLAIIAKSAVFTIADFDLLAAIEFAEINRSSRQNRDTSVTNRKMKFDDQIIAIAKVGKASAIYSDDQDIKKRAHSGLQVIGIGELPLPPETAQGDLLTGLPHQES